MLKALSFADKLAIGGVAFTVLLLFLDKVGKLKGTMLLVLLAVAAILMLPLVLNLSWVSDAQGLAKFSRGLLMVFAVGVLYSLIAVWAFNDEAQKEEASTISKEQAVPSPRQVKTLHDFYKEDCKGLGTQMMSDYTVVGTNDQGQPAAPYKIEYQVCTDFRSKTYFVMFFLPDSGNTLVTCQALPEIRQSLVTDIKSGALSKLFKDIYNSPPVNAQRAMGN